MLSNSSIDDGANLTQAQLASGGGGQVELDGDMDWREAAPRIASAVHVDIRFDSFKDGRGFTLATQLRQRAGFRGHLRATGDLIPDQAQFLRRVGFDAIAPDRTDLDADWRQAEERFSVVYQPANDQTPTAVARRQLSDDDIVALNARYREMSAEEILRDALSQSWAGRIAVLSSFGAEAAVGLHLVSQIAPDTPVLFLDTDRHFAQTEQYRASLSQQLGLTAVRLLKPDAQEVAAKDADNLLWQRDADACCALRKVRPLDAALGEFDALITGRKRFHGGARMRLPVVERVDGRIRLNPLANWTGDDIDSHFERFDLPRHPLSEMGYASIGCWTCTAPATDAGSVRDGRWPGQNKTECGIHTPAQIAAE
jgi:phosphoadenosine phosphosulfate reductase